MEIKSLLWDHQQPYGCKNNRGVKTIRTIHIVLEL